MARTALEAAVKRPAAGSIPRRIQPFLVSSGGAQTPVEEVMKHNGEIVNPFSDDPVQYSIQPLGPPGGNK
jgi:hypothetical protein